MSDAIEDLYRLKRLRDEGGISDDQYEIQREAALARAARRGTATPQAPRSHGSVVMLALLAIALSLGALALVLTHRTPTAAPPARQERPGDPGSSRLIPNGMTTWDGTQSMADTGTQDMRPAENATTPAAAPTPDAGQAAAQPAPDTPPAQASTTPAAPAAATPDAGSAAQVQAPPQAVEPEVRLNAQELSQAFQNNPNATESRLAGRKLVVTGVVDHAVLDIPDYPALDLQGVDPQHDVGVNLDRGSAPRAGALTPGARVTVVCDTVTDMAGLPMLDRCVL